MSLKFLRKDWKANTTLQQSYEAEALPQALVDLGSIINNDLCHRCGSCIGICPVDVLTTDDQEFPAIKNLAACINCNLCVKVCPGVDFDVPKYTQKVFEREANILDMHGYYQHAYLGHAHDSIIRQNATSGGVGTTVLAHLLETGRIDGAVI